MMKKERLSFLAMILCLVLCIGLFPAPAAAIGAERYGKLEITKVIERAEGVDETLINESEAFSEMQFTLYANEDIINADDGSVVTKKGDIGKLYDPNTRDFTRRAIITTHTNGVFTLEYIPNGKYSLKETKTPDGIVSSTVGNDVSIDPSENDGSNVTLTLTNDTIKTKFHNTDASGENMLAGSGLAVHKKDGTAFTRKNTSTLAWTSSDQAYFLEGLPTGEYFLRQTSAAEGYVLRTSDLSFTVANTKDVQNVTMKNKQVTLEKAAVNGKKITGGTVTVTDKATDAVVDTWTDDGTAHAIKNLTQGHTYTVQETAPANSIVTFHDMDFTVNSDYSQNQALLWNAFTCTHRGGTATCKDQAACDYCGKPYGELNSSNHVGTLGEWQRDGNGHWKTYSCCSTEKGAEAAHNFGEDGKCECGAVQYTITFDPNGGAVDTTSATTDVDGKLTELPTPTRGGSYRFDGWFTEATGGTQVTTDTVFSNATTIYAHWTYTGSSGGGGGSGSTGGGGGGSSSGSSSASTTVTVPVSSDSGTVNVRAEVSKNGTATVEISDRQIESVAKNGSGTVTVDVSSLKNVESVQVPAHVVDTTNRAESTGLTVALPTGSVSLDETALESVTTGKDVTVSVQKVPATDLTEAQQKAVGDMANIGLVVDVDLTVGSAKQSSFNGGRLTISVPYTPKRGQDVSRLTVWFIRDDGTIENKGGYYDAEKGCFVFETDHLSRYLLVYDDSAPVFADVPADAYFADAVSWAVQKGVTGGVTNTTFAPYAPCTRAQIVTFLYRYAVNAGLDVSVGEDTNILSYNDAFEVPEYAIPAFQWAVGAGITQGNHGNLMPNQSCTRAQAVAFLYRFAALAGMDAVTMQELVSGFGDAAQVPGYALAPFNWALAKGIVQGNDGKLMPNQTCTRAQIVTFLYRAFR